MKANNKMKSYILYWCTGKSKLVKEKSVYFDFWPLRYIFIGLSPHFWKTETELILEINMFRRLPPIANFYRFEIRSFVFQ